MHLAFLSLFSNHPRFIELNMDEQENQREIWNKIELPNKFLIIQMITGKYPTLYEC